MGKDWEPEDGRGCDAEKGDDRGGSEGPKADQDEGDWSHDGDPKSPVCREHGQHEGDRPKESDTDTTTWMTYDADGQRVKKVFFFKPNQAVATIYVGKGYEKRVLPEGSQRHSINLYANGQLIATWTRGLHRDGAGVTAAAQAGDATRLDLRRKERHGSCQEDAPRPRCDRHAPEDPARSLLHAGGGALWCAADVRCPWEAEEQPSASAEALRRPSSSGVVHRAGTSWRSRQLPISRRSGPKAPPDYPRYCSHCSPRPPGCLLFGFRFAS